MRMAWTACPFRQSGHALRQSPCAAGGGDVGVGVSFVESFNALPQRKPALLRRFESLLEPVPPEGLERMAQESMRVTRRHFGKSG